MSNTLTEFLSYLWTEFWPTVLAAIGFYIVVALAFWIPTASDTQFAGVIAAGAAIGSSLLTWVGFQYTENRKHDRHVQALKVGVVEELTASLQFVLSGRRIRVVEGYARFESNISRKQINTGFPIYTRAAGSIALTGSKFTASAIAAYTKLSASFPVTGVLFTWTALDTIEFVIPLLECTIDLPAKSTTRNYTTEKLKELSKALAASVCDTGKTYPFSEPNAKKLNQFLNSVCVELEVFDSSMEKFNLQATGISAMPMNIPLWRPVAV